MQGLGKLKNKKINCIPNKTVISFSIENLDFIDSLQYMNASLERLVSNLLKNGADMFPILQKHGSGASEERIVWKSLIKKLRPQECFYSGLNDEHIFDADYDHAILVSLKLSVAKVWVITMIYS
jgi:hypothetical protein